MIVTAAAAIAGFVGAANAGDTSDILGSINLKPDQVLTSEDMSKVVGTFAAAGAASAAAAGSNFANANQYTTATVFPSVTAVGSSAGTAF